MTREAELLIDMWNILHRECHKVVTEENYDVIKKAIKALDQEPCEDAISRQAVLDIVDSYSESRSNVEDVTQDMISDILVLPPVNPQPKTGYWIYDDECHEHGHCSECGYGKVDLVNGEPHNFCRRCGAKMEVSDGIEI